MSYQPVIPSTGNLGWSFLKSSREDQQRAFDNSTSIKTNSEYFREKIGGITSAEELVSDRRLTSVALGAFGLDDDINNRYFVQKVLEEGTLDSDSFANRLSDKRYFAMAEAFSFHLDPPNTALSNFPDAILKQYSTRQFEVAVGKQDEDLRLALGLSRDITELSDRNLTEDTAWFTIMGNPPMRRVFETALGLPKQLAAIDLDQQLGEFKAKAQSMFGTSDPADFIDETLQEKLVRNFLVRSELQSSSFASPGGAIALTLLQSLTPN